MAAYEQTVIFTAQAGVRRIFVALVFFAIPSWAECTRPAPGSVVQEPAALRSTHGVLEVELTYSNQKSPHGDEQFCYQDQSGNPSPTLHVTPGDLLILRLRNRLSSGSEQTGHTAMHGMTVSSPCADGGMTAASTNLHFHGMTVPAQCHEDDVLHTFVQPGDKPYEYRFQVPTDESPGLYWYHPHVHGFTNPQVLGGASGVLIVDGIERANTLLAGFPERIFVIRDQELLHPDAKPPSNEFQPPPMRDAEGDILNTGTGTGKPAKDLSINFVPVPYPDYTPAQIRVRPGQRALWRVLNACALTYIDLQILVGDKPVPLGVVSLDGAPINENGLTSNRVLWVNHVFLPPSSRVEFIFKGLPADGKARLITRGVDTGPDGENDPARPLAAITADPEAPPPPSRLPDTASPMAASSEVWLGNIKPSRTRKLYFSEKPEDPGRAGSSPTVFMITAEGETPAPFDPHRMSPDMTVRQGGVEDWVVENRSREMHAFHIHQVRFMLTQWNGAPVDEPFLRDTINIPYWDGKSTTYPSVTIRLDFRDAAPGTFVYHCHLLEHEDGGMMGTIQVVAK
jgi:FtsP/CotA-like multicopper oxidase with cupredoxin domain